MSNDITEVPVIPVDEEDAIPQPINLVDGNDAMVQRWHKLHPAIDEGEDERGPFDVIPLAMMRGAEAKPVKVHKRGGMKHIETDSSIPPRGWYKSKVERSRVRPRPCYTEAILTTPYGGFCPVGCSFCYINNGSRGYRATGLPTVDVNYPEKFKAQLDKMMVAGAGYMTSFSEAFHPMEDTFHVTERLTEVFVDAGLPIFYCSRKLPAEWAVEAMQKNPYSYMQWSINTGVRADFKKLSPGAASIDDTMAYIKRFRELGIYVSIQCNPINPGITSLDELIELVWELAENGANHVIFKFTEQVMNARQVIIDRLVSRRFAQDRIDKFDAVFNQVIGGVYTVQQDMRVAWLTELLAQTREAGITMSLCYEYYEDGKGGANMAPYFTTSDQCHGRGVPIHYRPEPGAKFQPLPGCYRKGCLYCAEHGTRACRSHLLQMAPAMEYQDLKSTVLVGYDEDWNLPESCARPEDEHRNVNANPGFKTDAELWGLPPLDEVMKQEQRGPKDRKLVNWETIARLN